jgi:hypothetical protein
LCGPRRFGHTTAMLKTINACFKDSKALIVTPTYGIQDRILHRDEFFQIENRTEVIVATQDSLRGRDYDEDVFFFDPASMFYGKGHRDIDIIYLLASHNHENSNIEEMPIFIVIG